MSCLLPYNLLQQSPLLGEGEQRSSFHLTLLTKAVKADKEREIEFLRNNLVINGSEWDGNGEKKQYQSTFKIGSRQKFSMNFCQSKGTHFPALLYVSICRELK